MYKLHAAVITSFEAWKLLLGLICNFVVGRGERVSFALDRSAVDLEEWIFSF